MSALRHTVMRGGLWVLALKVVKQASRFILVLLVARVVSPAEFGVFGIALLAIATIDTFTQFGFEHALIQKKEDIAPFLNTAWTMTLVKGILGVLVLYTAAPVIGLFFAEPAVVPLLRALSLVLFFRNAVHVGVVYFNKELAFRRYVALSFQWRHRRSRGHSCTLFLVIWYLGISVGHGRW